MSSNEYVNPFFSIVVPCYNREKYIFECLESVLNQEFNDFELIVVDDGSCDSTVSIVDSFKDKRIRLIRIEHAGGPTARSVGILAASGDFVIALGSDDVFLPGALERIAGTIKEFPTYDVYYGDLEIFYENDGSSSFTKYPDYASVDILPILIKGNCLPDGGTAIRRELFKTYGGYDTSFVRCHDYQLWTRLAASAKFKKVDSVNYQWRIHGNNLSSTKSRFFEGKVVLDAFLRYPVSRLFPDLKDDSAGELESSLRVISILEGLGEYTLAIRQAYKLARSGFDMSSRLEGLLKVAGSNYSPMFSVILTTFNRPELLEFALDSLSKQTLKDFEVVLVNDFGVPVEGLLSSYDIPITYIRQKKNLGVAAARNIGIKASSGENIVFLDDDDFFRPDHLQTLADCLDDNPGAVVYSDACFIVEEVEGGNRKVLSEEVRYAHDNYSKYRLMVDNYIPVNTFSFPKRLFESIGEFDVSLKGLEDWDFLIRLANVSNFYHVSKQTVEVRMRTASADPERRSVQAHSFYPEIYQEIYRRYPSPNQFVKNERNKLLKRMGIDASGSHTADINIWLNSRHVENHRDHIKDLPASDINVYVLCCGNDISFVDTEKFSSETIEVSYLVSPEQYIENLVPAEKAVVKETTTIAECLLQQLEHSTAEWFVLLSPDDVLTSSGLLMAQIELSKNPNLSAISFDEIYRMEDGSLGAAFRPAGNLDYLLSFPAGMSRHWLFNRKALLEIGGFNPELPDAFELDAILRLINKGGLECIGHVSEPLVITPPPALANVDDERKAIEQHLRDRGYEQAELHAPNPGRYQIRYNHPSRPIVSVVLAAGNNLTALQRCVEGLLSNTHYQNFEILFIQQPDSGSEVKEWLDGLAAMQEPKLRVFASRYKTLAEQRNQVQEHAIGDYLLFLSPDTAIVAQHWLDELLNHAQRGEVGIVGAKLLTPEGNIAHAGHILGLEGPVGTPFVGEPLDAPGYMQRLQVDQNLSSVSGDCLMVLRELFVQLGGFANSELANEYLSTDLCLRAREAGFLIVWTPHAQLMLDREQTSAPTAEQQDVMYEKWLPQLARDPAYNPNFSLSMPGGFKLADTQISWRPLDSIRPAPVALVHPADLMGCGHYRVMQPFLAMKGEGLVDGAISTGLMHVTDLERYNPDCIVLQRQIGDARLEAMQRMQKFSRAVKVYELDDYLPNLPLKSVHRKDMPKDILRSLRRGLSFVDRFVVSTHALAEAFSGLHGEIVVRENRLPLSWWGGLQTERRQGKKPRVGWAGGSSHTGDLELIADVVRDLADEVEWVFFGMCPEALKPYVHEFHGGVPIEQYPAKLASLNLDLGLAPLEHNLFNECKSNLRQLEYGVCGIPIICTDIRPYQDGLQAGLPVTLVKNRYKDWVDAIRMHINDLDATAKMADELQTRVKADWMLQGEHLVRWRDAWLGR